LWTQSLHGGRGRPQSACCSVCLDAAAAAVGCCCTVARHWLVVVSGRRRPGAVLLVLAPAVCSEFTTVCGLHVAVIACCCPFPFAGVWTTAGQSVGSPLAQQQWTFGRCRGRARDRHPFVVGCCCCLLIMMLHAPQVGNAPPLCIVRSIAFAYVCVVCVCVGHRSEPLHSFEWGSDSVTSVRWNPSESHVLAATGTDRSIALYDVRGATPIRKVTLEVRGGRVSLPVLAECVHRFFVL
jgi:hypothetical protein